MYCKQKLFKLADNLTLKFDHLAVSDATGTELVKIIKLTSLIKINIIKIV